MRENGSRRWEVVAESVSMLAVCYVENLAKIVIKFLFYFYTRVALCFAAGDLTIGLPTHKRKGSRGS